MKIRPFHTISPLRIDPQSDHPAKCNTASTPEVDLRSNWEQVSTTQIDRQQKQETVPNVPQTFSPFLAAMLNPEGI